MPRRELKIQDKICSSYTITGRGYACKWDPAHAKGKPDLVCSLQTYGSHFLEVKHRPDWSPTNKYKNALEPKQMSEARKLINADANVWAALVIGGSIKMNDARMAFLDPLEEEWDLWNKRFVGWDLRMKRFPVELLIEETKYG